MGRRKQVLFLSKNPGGEILVLNNKWNAEANLLDLVMQSDNQIMGIVEKPPYI